MIPLDEYLSKLQAALAARSDPDFFIIARTDTLAVHGMEDTLRRCEAFAAAGADAVFVDAPRSVEDLQAIASAMRSTGVPLVFNSARTGRSPVMDEGRHADLGYSIVLYPLEAMLIAQHAVQDGVRVMMDARTTEATASRMLSFDEVNALVDLKAALSRGSVER